MFNKNDPNYDRIDVNESDGMKFYGYDDGEGKTAWYDENGNLDNISETPDEDEENFRAYMRGEW